MMNDQYGQMQLIHWGVLGQIRTVRLPLISATRPGKVHWIESLQAELLFSKFQTSRVETRMARCFNLHQHTVAT